ncbi:MAG: glycosyl hydrolase-related protein [Actinomycetota bacterium]|nr:glycosyl hydrolase-related protein [Actinomycetota bacterium]
MHDDRHLTAGRLQRMLRRVRDGIYSLSTPVELSRWDAPGEPVSVAEGLAARYAPTSVGDPWGPPWSTSWFHVLAQVPAGWAGSTVELRLDIGFDPQRTGFHTEGLVYTPEGTPVKALNPATQWVRVGDPAAGGEQVDLFVEAAANPLLLGGGGFDFTPSLLGDPATAGTATMYRVERAELAVFEPEVWELVQDLEVLGQLAAELEPSDARGWQLLRAIDRSLDRVDVADVSGTAAAARAELVDALGAPARASAHRISAIGHAHIDSAWLWPIRETIRKVARTTSNVVDLMDHHPELIYAMSSAQQFAWLRDHRPEVYAKVVAKVRDGRFIPVGGMWVESDTNMPGGEALARQFSHGKRFFLDEFGIETREVWLPDSFGYTAALPQLMKLSGSKWFLTQKISWNTTNRFPHHSFRWEGLDGTRIFTHFPSADTYGSEVSGAELAHAARNFSDKAEATRSMLPFGWGDGGGGPTSEMLARIARVADLDGSPRVQIETPAEFFAKAEQEYPASPIWAGELYLEMHRGTYTSQAKTKQGNRRSEHLLREAELWCTAASVRTGADYPSDALDRLWKVLLLHQFHDILPGSSISWVHREAAEAYAAIATELESLIANALAVLAGQGDRPMLFNATPHRWDEVPAMGGLATARPSAVRPVPDGDGYLLDNGLLRVCIDARGLLSSVLDLRRGREVLSPGVPGNLLQLHPDTPVMFDAWDVDSYYRHSVTDLVDADSVEATDDAVVVVRSFGRSVVRQRISLPAQVARVDLEADIDWQEQEKILKASFDVDVQTDRSASEIQFGHVYRATHTNTTWEAAKFEICAHRWVQVAEPGYGVAIVNDSTYGHDISRADRQGGGVSSRMRLSLLRAPLSPDPLTDQGRHRLRYALVPGAKIDDAVREGYRINLPARTVAGSGTAVAPLLNVDNPAVVVESVKLADDESGDVILRLYESRGGRADARVHADFRATAVTIVDLLERPLGEDQPQLQDGIVALALRPFQIVTLRFARD